MEREWAKVTLILVHKRTSILTFEGLSTTFEASTNVNFTYFCHKIKYYNGNICVKVASKMFSSNTKQLGTHVQSLAIQSHLLAAHVRDKNSLNH